MKIIILCILALSIGIVAKAQSATANLNITLTDVQSVKFGEVSQEEAAPAAQENAPNSDLKVLSRSTSQVKKIHSKTEEYEKLYKELSSKLGSAAIYTAAAVAPVAKRSSQGSPPVLSHIIYQVDPR